MNGLQKSIQKQCLEYSKELNELEKEFIRKYETGEDYSVCVTRAAELKILKDECVRMMKDKRW